MRHVVYGRGVVKELKRDSCVVRFLQDDHTREILYDRLAPTT